MKNTQSVAELLNTVDVSYLTENEKYEAIARAERAEYIAESVAEGIQNIKNAVAKVKAVLTSSSAQHV
ncbi:hypothetical protein J9B83_12775 [Marinomonas sp. A79]|uniref:Uncharacterized protein n=1 Tax=Marinomonas vulgaris TaxID=2823372 RepID=A0ABS5HDS0_9GAMM|nr:hypothetical protein [Marinomonas vulgaris]MBR7889806.1 hypothetical protein [Marinomonas vulgaris]